jgi:hypothetical protein
MIHLSCQIRMRFVQAAPRAVPRPLNRFRLASSKARHAQNLSNDIISDFFETDSDPYGAAAV